VSFIAILYIILPLLDLLSRFFKSIINFIKMPFLSNPEKSILYSVYTNYEFKADLFNATIQKLRQNGFINAPNMKVLCSPCTFTLNPLIRVYLNFHPDYFKGIKNSNY
jgi:hypothetical protein